MKMDRILNPETQAQLAGLRREVAPHIVEWWNDWAGRLGFSPIPPDWVPWPEVHNKPEEGVHDRGCFWNAGYCNHKLGLPVIVGVHFGYPIIQAMVRDEDLPSHPFRHAVNLDHHGRIVDVTWGHTQMTGLMVGRPFAVAPRRMGVYCTERGFPI